MRGKEIVELQTPLLVINVSLYTTSVLSFSIYSLHRKLSTASEAAEQPRMTINRCHLKPLTLLFLILASISFETYSNVKSTKEEPRTLSHSNIN